MAQPVHTATTEHVSHSETGGVFPPFDTQTFPSQLVALVIAFVLFYALLAKVALPKVGAVIDNRQKRIADDFAEADRLKTESEAAVVAYEKALADARSRAQAIAAKTRQEQAAQAEAARKSLEDKLHGQLAEAEKTIAATKRTAMTNVRAIAQDAAAAIVEQLLGKAPSEQALAEAVTDALKR
jgi:F-type H+-transporting ATPase subunit b